MSNPTESTLLEFGGFIVPAGCRRILITAELEPSNEGSLIQPTGFPDLGPVLYPDPGGKNGLICLIESEASMANRLEEVCFDNKYVGSLKNTFDGLPYLKAETNREFTTASTIDGHRFASDFLAKGKAKFSQDGNETTLADHIKTSLAMTDGGKSMPVANIPNVFPLVMGLDPMSLIHGFQISNEQIKFVGLRLPRALNASIVGFNCNRVTVPGIKFNVGQVDSDSGQAIFQKARITAKKIEARFSIDVGLLASLRLDHLEADDKPGQYQSPRLQLLLAISLWKVATFLDLLKHELSLRTECKLRIKRNETKVAPQYSIEGATSTTGDFGYEAIAATSLANDSSLISKAGLPKGRSPLTLQF
ncbi:CRISPR-associated protein GSU0053 (Cas_GSU0053) [Prosthecobacter debontii]|uniref:CRISPR-associated protein GSU0053 (Cas_GSU0053) n=1 Tax=Prosthecobacter debontii TaxID=48467 RepID=A0A1T4YL68_9BACT|nr:type I-U CRISPR-associated protein Cas7 [Prosthecobacter debontii]SKB02015.1 CRISPR-associated protein GSU0053 (Cas_GSU0053) [Prosthecobacter debontii]